MTLDKTLKEIKDRCEAATEGPWLKRTRTYDGEEVLCYRESKVVAWNNTNLKFIAHARTDVPMLLEMVEYCVQRGQCCSGTVCPEDLEEIAEKYKGAE